MRSFAFTLPLMPPKENSMEKDERLAKLEAHVRENPKDYQAVIAAIKLHSDLIDAERRQREILELRHISEIRKRRRHEEQR